MAFKSWFGALEDAGGSWLRFGILIFIWIWSLVFGTPMFQILALYLNFEGAKNIHVHWVLICGFGWSWRFLTGVLDLDQDLDMVTELWYTYDLNFGFLSSFLMYKEHPCPLRYDLGLLRLLDDPDWSLGSWSWFGYGHWSLIHPCSELLNPKWKKAKLLGWALLSQNPTKSLPGVYPQYWS